MPRAAVSVLLAGVIATGSSVHAFVPATSSSAMPRSELRSSTTDEGSVNMKESYEPRRNRIAMSEAIPFLQRPAVLTGDLAGDFGFDPLGLSNNMETLYAYREAEIKHARLAMLVSTFLLCIRAIQSI